MKRPLKYSQVKKSQQADWFGERHFFEVSSWRKKEVLEVTLYREDDRTSFRYIVHNGWKFTFQDGLVSEYRDDAFPFWVRKVLFSFHHPSSTHLFDYHK